MIELPFHWAWLLMAAVCIVSIQVAYPFIKKTGDDIGSDITRLVGWTMIALGVIFSLIIGNKFIW